MKTRTMTLTICTVVALTGLTATAFAQDAAPPPANTAPVTRAGRTSGDIANGGLGVGATMYTSGLFGPEVVYDFGLWHLEGMLGFDHRPDGGAGDAPTTTIFDFGVGGWYHLHLGENSDFSLGAAFGLLTESHSGPGPSATAFEFEPGAQVRAFITPNVALHGGLGFVFAFGDYVGPLEKQISLAGQVTGNLGFTYYFR